MPKKSFEIDWKSQNKNELRLIYGLTLEQEPSVYRDVKIFFNSTTTKFVVTSNLLKEEKAAPENWLDAANKSTNS